MYNPEEKEADLMEEYSPPDFSLSCRNQLEPLLSSYIWFTSIAAEHRKSLIDSGVKCKYLRYAGVDDYQTVDIFYKEGNDFKPSPLFVFIPGVDAIPDVRNDRYVKDHSASMVGPLVKNGYRVAIMGYNIMQNTVPERMEEFEDFVTWLLKYADRSQTTDITFAGHGAGAQLVTHLLHNPGCIPDCSRSKIKSVFLLSGFYDFRELESFGDNLLNNAIGINEENASTVSPMLWCWKDDSQKWGCLQIHVLTVEHASVTMQEQSRQFSQVLEAAGFKSIFRQFDGLDHYTIILDQNVERNEITNYIKTAMQKASGESSKGSNRPCTCASKR